MFNGETTKYMLNGVVEHLGAGVDHGHYTCYQRGFDGRTWYHFDDDMVSGNVW